MAYSGLIAPGTSRVGSISPMRDYDTYNTTFIEGLTYSVAAKGYDSGSGTLRDPYIRLVGTNIYNDDINPGVNRDAQITFSIGAGGTGTWTLGVNETGNNATGSYTLTVSLGYATNGTDRVVGTASNDGIHGMDGNDTIYGQGGNDNLVGALGNDQLLGGVGADLLNGGSGADVLRGQDGADRLLGGAGTDRLIGGANADRFVFNAVSDSNARGTDVISAGDGATAFQGIGVRGGDVIDLSGIDANVNYAGNQAFGFSASRAAGTVVLSQDSYGNTILSGHVNNDREADFRLVIQDGSVTPYAYSGDEFML